MIIAEVPLYINFYYCGEIFFLYVSEILKRFIQIEFFNHTNALNLSLLAFTLCFLKDSFLYHNTKANQRYGNFI